MRLHEISGPLSPALAEAFERFEGAFSYPLGSGRRFSISHERDPHRFFGAMGEAACFILEEEGLIAGSASIAVRRMITPEGEERNVNYIGDLKVAPFARGGRTLLRLARALEAWGLERAETAYSVVMDGTRPTPADYTGRAGIAALEEIAKVVIFRLPSGAAPRAGPRAVDAAPEDILTLFRRWSRGRVAVLPGDPARRSAMRPCPLVLSGGEACGLLEDTMKAKRLLSDDGSELSSAHLSAFAFAAPGDGAALIAAAAAMAREKGLDALFVSVSPDDAGPLGEALGRAGIVEAPATIYGAGLRRGAAWNLNTSEI